MDGRCKLAGWEIYPENLSYVQSCDLHGYNFTSYGQQLKADSPRIFLPSYEKISVKVIEFGVQGNSRTDYIRVQPKPHHDSMPLI
jgi:hypothetical protein